MNKSSIQDFLRNYSIETTVPQAQRVERFADLLPPGTCLYIAHIPGTDFSATVALAARLRQEGMEPVPHVVGRRIESRAVLDDFLRRLSGEAGVTQALVVAGDNADPAGEFTSGLQLLESGLLEQYGIRTVGVAGHPEGHREVGDPVLRDALRRKNAYKVKTGAHVYLVTQFAFSADPVLA
jgi:methylenetetrahydrofolate reductase (NADPH)